MHKAQIPTLMSKKIKNHHFLFTKIN